MLKIENLNYTVNEKNILKNISYSFKKGELVGLLGANGSGKSTLLKTIVGFLKKDSGSINFDKLNLTLLNRNEISKIISYLPQNTNKNLGFTGKEFISLGRVPHIKNPFKGLEKQDIEHIEKIVKKLELYNFLEKKVNELSGGEYQLLLLARVFIQNGDILVLDEPTSALDINHSLKFLTYLKNEVKIKNKIGIVAIHDINLATLFCDKIIFLKNGKIKYSGTPREIITETNLKDIYNYKPKIFKSKTDIYVVPKKEDL